jgi:glycosyltransferase involved in cell wall biosynthesis
VSRVSVIIPAHNAQRHISESMMSALNQRNVEVEVVVVIDSSNDDTRKIADSLADKRVKITEIDAGSAAAARNIGLSHSQGDYIQYLDADDALSLDKIKEQIDLLRAHGEFSIANCPWGHFIDTPEAVELQLQSINRDIDPKTWLVESWSGGGMSQTACWLTPRNLIERAGNWDETMKRNPNDDGEFFCRVMLKAKHILFSHRSYVCYRKPSGSSVSRIAREDQAESLLRSYIACENHLRLAEDSKRTQQAAAQNYYKFIYHYAGKYDLLVQEAWQQIDRLGRPACCGVGPKLFQHVVSRIGFRNTMRICMLKRRTFN